MTRETSIVTLGSDPARAASEQLDRLLAALGYGGRVVAISEDLVVIDEALAPIDADSLAPTSALVVADARGDLAVQHHRVVSAGTSFHRVADPTHRSVGALVIAEADAAQACKVIVELRGVLVSGELQLEQTELLEAVLVALVRGQIPVRAVEMVDVPWFRSPQDPQAAQESAYSVSRQRVRGLLANRTDDGFYSTFVVRKASKPLTRLALRLGLSPNTITVLSFLIGLGAAALFATGQWGWIVLGAIALQVSLIVDCVDGEVARATRRFSALGAWLDAATDRVKEFAAYAGLAIGAARQGMDVWWIAIALVVLQTTRHVSDYDFARIQRLREARVPEIGIRQSDDGRTRGSGALAGAMHTSARVNRRSGVRWFKKVIHMPIGERWLVLSVVAIIAGPAWALGALLIAGVLALAYVAAGRLARTLTWSGPTPGDGPDVLRVQLDAGPLLALVSRVGRPPSMTGRFAWAIPVGLRAIELSLIAVLVAVLGPANPILAFWMLFAVAYHHYDTLYRSLQGSAPPRWLSWWGFGWDGRLIVLVAIITITVGNALDASLTALLAWWVLWFAGVASIQWLRSSR